jgi:phosphoribosyl-ATP pyrophosphohydrolase/phosphoribosyl-AMP cyclohydrolase
MSDKTLPELPGLIVDAQGLLPVVAQEATTGEVLMLAYANREALERTLETGFAHYFSRSRLALWKKGESSGHLQRVREVRYDCDADTLLYLVEQEGPACHTGARSCFFRVLQKTGESGETAAILDRIYRVILDRKQTLPADSYVASLLRKGKDAVLKKVAEEAGELILSAKGDRREAIIWEAADLWFHTLVALAEAGITPAEVYGELGRRFGKRGGKP